MRAQRVAGRPALPIHQRRQLGYLAAFRAGAGDLRSPGSAFDWSHVRILACSGTWALVDSDDGVRGWWRALCSNQVTNCS